MEGDMAGVETLWEGIILSGWQKWWEGICPSGKTTGGDLSGVAKMMGGDMSGREFVHTPTPIHPPSHLVCGGYNDIFAAIELN